MKALTHLLFVSALSLPLFASSQTIIGGVSLPAKIESESGALSLNGGGIREKLWIDLYVGGLYLHNKNSNANDIINADKAMSIYIEIVSTLITSEKMIAAVDEGFIKSTKGNTAPFEKEINTYYPDRELPASSLTDLEEAYDLLEKIVNYEPTDQQMMSSFGTKWHDGL